MTDQEYKNQSVRTAQNGYDNIDSRSETMKGNRRHNFYVIVVLSVIWLLWVTIYNQKCHKYKETAVVKKYETTGEWIPYGDNYNGTIYCKGYSMRINQIRIVEAEEYVRELAEIGYKENRERNIPLQKVCEIEVTLKNENNTDMGIDFLSTHLIGEDFYTTLECKWFEIINELNTDTMGGIRLRENTEYTVRLPYSFNQLVYREKTGRKLETENMWLVLTGYPEEIWARVQ